jgi:hypothetical protein
VHICFFVGWEKLDFIGFCSFFSYCAGAWIWSISALLVGWGKLDFLGFLLFSHILELEFCSKCACSGSLTSLGFCSFPHILLELQFAACLLVEGNFDFIGVFALFSHILLKLGFCSNVCLLLKKSDFIWFSQCRVLL